MSETVRMDCVVCHVHGVCHKAAEGCWQCKDAEIERLKAELATADKAVDTAAKAAMRLKADYQELAAAVWCCPVDELEEPLEATLKEAARQPMEIERLEEENRQLQQEVAKLRKHQGWTPHVAESEQ